MSSRGSAQPNSSTTNQPASSSSAVPSSRKRARVYSVASTGFDILGNISEASDILSPLKAACRTSKSIIDVIQTADDNQDEWNELIQRLDGYMSAVQNQIDAFEKYPPEERAVDDALSQSLVEYVKLLGEFHDKVDQHKHKRSRTGFGPLTTISKIKLDPGDIRKFHRDLEDQHRQLMEKLGFFAALRLQVIERNTKVILTEVDASAILQLPMVAFVASSVHNPCLQGTRQAVLETIWRWAEDDMSEKPIFWLCDIAGSGKSTVAMSVAQAWRSEGTLGAQFFFSLANSEGSTTEKFCSTLARELVQHMPELAPHIAETVKRNPAIMRSSFQDQIRTLVTSPLKHLQGRAILVVDAVDECKSGTHRKELLDGLAMAARETSNLKIFITSRPDPIIESVLQPLSIKAQLKDRLHDVSHHDNIDDIATYVHQSLYGVLSQDKRERLVEKANGLFIWASTACRMLSDKTSLSPPEDIYNRLMSIDEDGGIDDLYCLIFERTNPAYYTIMYEMLALLLAAFEPLTSEDLDDALKHAKIKGSAKALVQNLGSVLIEDGTSLIQFRHPTFVEYLRRCSVAPEANSGNRIYINVLKAHGQAASWCFKCLQSPAEGLRFNICQIESSFSLNSQIKNLETKVSKFIRRRLRYASSHWLFHLAETDDNWRSKLEDDIRRAIQIPHVLYWMEILSFIGGVPRVINGLRTVTRCKGVSGQSL
ncbi:related to archipelago beta form (F-box-WD40 repeat protein) [Serendipita indica DSM 11827]|uniref:Related to archipelago beta form (F-box-WD40 repeat protein) n=1 Tax=Serendipita indica (strain DSM 11827) TaxID=1109443 RepID=G4TLI7_SERID|nr:related to archipelago beta form (F-box-WD40 repeat protein) [Serendipita indica DSM 11827]